jgi:hypothetical protein
MVLSRWRIAFLRGRALESPLSVVSPETWTPAPGPAATPSLPWGAGGWAGGGIAADLASDLAGCRVAGVPSVAEYWGRGVVPGLGAAADAVSDLEGRTVAGGASVTEGR